MDYTNAYYSGYWNLHLIYDLESEITKTWLFDNNFTNDAYLSDNFDCFEIQISDAEFTLNDYS